MNTVPLRENAKVLFICLWTGGLWCDRGVPCRSLQLNRRASPPALAPRARCGHRGVQSPTLPRKIEKNKNANQLISLSCKCSCLALSFLFFLRGLWTRVVVVASSSPGALIMALGGRLMKRLEQALTLYVADINDDIRWQFVHSFVYAQPGAAARTARGCSLGADGPGPAAA